MAESSVINCMYLSDSKDFNNTFMTETITQTCDVIFLPVNIWSVKCEHYSLYSCF